MRRWSRALTLGFVLVPAMGGLSPRPAAAQELPRHLERLRSDAESERAQAFRTLLSSAAPSGRSDVRTQTSALLSSNPSARAWISGELIALLSRENANFDAGNFGDAEGFISYYGDVIVAVAALRDPSAVPALVGAISTGNGAMDGLASLGSVAIPAVVEAARSSDPRDRSGAAWTLGKFAEPHRRHELTAAEPRDVEVALARSLDDEEGPVRQVAVRSLRHFSGAHIRARMMQIAATDPYVHHFTGRAVYPVREQAREWLETNR